MQNELFEDAVAARIPRFTQALQNLHGAVRMRFQQPHDLSLVRIELAGVTAFGTRLILGLLDPLGDGLFVEAQFASDLNHAEPLLVVEQSDLTEGGIIDHGLALRMRCRIWPIGSGWPEEFRGDAGSAETASSKSRTWYNGFS